jgi:hypothetical protein
MQVGSRAAILGLSHQAIYARLRNGWTLEEATTIPKGERSVLVGERRKPHAGKGRKYGPRKERAA